MVSRVIRRAMGVCAAVGVGASVNAVLAQSDSARVGMMVLEGAPTDSPGPLDWLMGGKAKTLRDLVHAVDSVAESDLRGVVIRLKDAQLSMAQIEELGDAMLRARAAGKKVHLYAEGYANGELALGAYADQVLVQHAGDVSLLGMHMDEMFMGDTLRWIGVEPDFVQVGDYKGASEAIARSSPSKEWDENINQLLDSLYGNLREKIKQGRKYDDAKLDATMADAWSVTPQTAMKLGLIDAEIDLPDLGDSLKATYGSRVVFDSTILRSGEGINMDMANPFAMLSVLMRKPDRDADRPTIAIVHIAGPIVDGESASGGLFGGGGSVGSRTVRRALDEIERQPLIKGVIVRIDSPGGSAIASENIWLGLKKLSESRPVWVSVGSMAASGGYYIAVSGSKVYVNPSSIVGSIGVVGGKLATQSLFDWAKIGVVERSRGPRAGMMSMSRKWSDGERELVRSRMKEVYDLFTQRVTAGRSGIDLAKTAEGRLFTGDKAVALKMADKVGSLHDAVGDMAAELSLADGAYDLMDFPGPKGFEEFFEDMMGGVRVGAFGARSDAPALAQAVALGRAVLGDRAWNQVAAHLDAMVQLRSEPVLVTMPSAIIVR